MKRVDITQKIEHIKSHNESRDCLNQKRSVLANGWLEVDPVDGLNHYKQMSKNGKLDQFYR